MAEWRGHDRSVQFEHAFDRLLAVKLEQVYGILVPEWVRAIGVDQSVRGKRDEGCRDLRQSIFRAAELSRLGAYLLSKVEDDEDAYFILMLVILAVAGTLATSINLPGIVGSSRCSDYGSD
jgi:hypothetical protein